ncbi:MAG: helix-turn-helix transcriptional regulator [Aeromicrobium sp.]|uniref:helix-turn-helix domain-containing protein n=1 Tax=Aeromicrobium sp. TaxID=1871063 RepID=UPI0039E25FB1
MASHGTTTWEGFARELGHNLLRTRTARGMSQERLAHEAGIAAYTYQKFEKGESRPGAPMNPRLSSNDQNLWMALGEVT